MKYLEGIKNNKIKRIQTSLVLQGTASYDADKAFCQ